MQTANIRTIGYPSPEKLGRCKTQAPPVRMADNGSTKKLDLQHNLLNLIFLSVEGIPPMDIFHNSRELSLVMSKNQHHSILFSAIGSYPVTGCRRKQSVRRSKGDFSNGIGKRSGVENDRKLYGIACKTANKQMIECRQRAQFDKIKTLAEDPMRRFNAIRKLLLSPTVHPLVHQAKTPSKLRS